jgi:hypothetical protein
MKRLVGRDVGSVTFDASAQTITLVDLPTLGLENILLVTNVTDQQIIYNFANTALGGSISANVLTLDYDTTSMADADELQVWVDLPDSMRKVDSQSITEDANENVIQVVYTEGGMTYTLDITRSSNGNVSDWSVTLS